MDEELTPEEFRRLAAEVRAARDEILLVIGEFRTALTAFYRFNGVRVNSPDQGPLATPPEQD